MSEYPFVLQHRFAGAEANQFRRRRDQQIAVGGDEIAGAQRRIKPIEQNRLVGVEIRIILTPHFRNALLEAADHFASTRALTKTTILNVMERLRAKGFLTREAKDGIFQYSPTQAQATLMRSLVADFVDNMLGGSLEPFAAYLAEKETISDAELARLKEILREIEEKQQ